MRFPTLYVSARFAMMVCQFGLWFDYAMLPLPARVRWVLTTLEFNARLSCDDRLREQIRRLQAQAAGVHAALDFGVRMLETMTGKKFTESTDDSMAGVLSDDLRDSIRGALEREISKN